MVRRGRGRWTDGRQDRRGISAVKKQAQRQLHWTGEDQNQMKQRLSDAGVARLKGEKGRGREEKKKKKKKRRKKEGQLRDIKSMLLYGVNSGSSSLDPPSAPTFLSSTFSTSTECLQHYY